MKKGKIEEKIKYEIIKNPYTATGYASKTILWSFASTPINGQISSQMAPVSCRDSITHALKYGYSANSKRYLTVTGLGARYFRLIAWLKFPRKPITNDEWDDRIQVLKNGVHIVNLVEAHFGWPLTRMHTVKNSVVNTKTFMLVGSGRWHRAPVMVYLYILLLRMGKNKVISKCQTYDELYEFWTKKIAHGFPGGLNGYGHKSDASYIRKAAYYIPYLLSHFSQIFRGVSREDAWQGPSTRHNGGLVEFNRVLPYVHKNKGDAIKTKKNNGMVVPPIVIGRLYKILLAQGIYDKKQKTKAE